MDDLWNKAVVFGFACFVIIIVVAVSGKRVDSPPRNVEFSDIAIHGVEECMNESSEAGYYGSLSVYPNDMVECLYTAGFALEYNGEPVRRELTPND